MVKSSPVPHYVCPLCPCPFCRTTTSKAALSWESLPVDSSHLFSNGTFPCIPAFPYPAVLIAQGPQLG